MNHQVASAAPGSKTVVAVHSTLESQKATADSPDETLKVRQKKIAAVNSIEEEQRARLDATDAKMAKLKNRRDEASALTPTCCKKLLRMQKNLETVLKKVKASSAHAVAMAKERDAVTAQYEKQRSSVEALVDFVNNKTARLEAKSSR